MKQNERAAQLAAINHKLAKSWQAISAAANAAREAFEQVPGLITELESLQAIDPDVEELWDMGAKGTSVDRQFAFDEISQCMVAKGLNESRFFLAQQGQDGSFYIARSFAMFRYQFDQGHVFVHTMHQGTLRIYTNELKPSMFRQGLCIVWPEMRQDLERWLDRVDPPADRSTDA